MSYDDYAHRKVDSDLDQAARDWLARLATEKLTGDLVTERLYFALTRWRQRREASPGYPDFYIDDDDRVRCLGCNSKRADVDDPCACRTRGAR